MMPLELIRITPRDGSGAFYDVALELGSGVSDPAVATVRTEHISNIRVHVLSPAVAHLVELEVVHRDDAIASHREGAT
jgi:hypothetical protein